MNMCQDPLKTGQKDCALQTQLDHKYLNVVITHRRISEEMQVFTTFICV